MITPQLTMLLALALAVAWRLFHWHNAPMPFTVAFATFMFASHWLLFVEVSRAVKPAE
jgi:hypothetical protein